MAATILLLPAWHVTPRGTGRALPLPMTRCLGVARFRVYLDLPSPLFGSSSCYHDEPFSSPTSNNPHSPPNEKRGTKSKSRDDERSMDFCVSLFYEKITNCLMCQYTFPFFDTPRIPIVPCCYLAVPYSYLPPSCRPSPHVPFGYPPPPNSDPYPPPFSSSILALIFVHRGTGMLQRAR